MISHITESAHPLRHLALFYRGADQYASAARDFLLAGLRAGERALVIVPRRNADAIRSAMAAHLDAITFADMQAIGRNPARLMPALEEFIAGAGGRAVIIGEPVWPGRSEAETSEATRHEALINLAFAGSPATIVCPYDAARLPGRVIAGARSTHPVLALPGIRQPSPAYRGRDAIPAECDRPLPDPPAGAGVLIFCDDLRAVRALVADQAGLAGLGAPRKADLVLAVSELAANTLVHAGGKGRLIAWRTADEVICQIDDGGHIADPLAGRRLPHPEANGGQGLWVVNRCCDLTEVRTGTSGTTIRLHVRRTDEPSGHQNGQEGHDSARKSEYP